MRILALETSSREASVALLEDERVVQHATLEPGQRTAKWLAPTIERQFQTADWAPSEVELVAVTSGPGSFTGLRIGVTTAKTFAYASGASVLGINTLEVIAQQAFQNTHFDQLWAVLDAQRSQLFAAWLQRPMESGFVSAIDTEIVDADIWRSKLETGQAITGPGLARIRPLIRDDVAVVDRELWTPRAVTLGRIAHHRFRAGQRDDLWKLVPQYFRKSAAEEKI